MAPACWSAFKSPLTWFALVALTFTIEKANGFDFADLFYRHAATREKEIKMLLLNRLKKKKNQDKWHVFIKTTRAV